MKKLTGKQKSQLESIRQKFGLIIPKNVAELLDDGDPLCLGWTHCNDLLGKVSDDERDVECKRRDAIAKVYLAGKELGIDLVEVRK